MYKILAYVMLAYQHMYMVLRKDMRHLQHFAVRRAISCTYRVRPKMHMFCEVVSLGNIDSLQDKFRFGGPLWGGFANLS